MKIQGIYFRHKKLGETSILFLSCVTQRSYVVVHGIHRRNQWHEFVPVSHQRVVLFPEKTLGRSISACLVVVAPAPRSPLLKRSYWYVTDEYRRAVDIMVRSLQNMSFDANFV